MFSCDSTHAMLILKNGNDLPLLLPWIPQSRSYKQAGLKGAVIVTNVK